MKLSEPRKSKERGVALLIVLLVTALLIALVFEFAYATRISLNSAVNFRDSQRAYFLALSGINAFKSNGALLRENFEPNVLHKLPLLDVDVLFMWEDESGKIKINDVKTDEITKSMVQTFLANKRIDSTVYDRMVDQTSKINQLTLLSGIREYLNSDEEFNNLNVYENFTVSQVAPHIININRASADVLRSMGITEDAANVIVENRKERAYTPQDIISDTINGISGLKLPPASGNFIKTYLTANEGQVLKVSTEATVGGYTKKIEVILNGSALSYWKAL